MEDDPAVDGHEPEPPKKPPEPITARRERQGEPEPAPERRRARRSPTPGPADGAAPRLGAASLQDAARVERGNARANGSVDPASKPQPDGALARAPACRRQKSGPRKPVGGFRVAGRRTANRRSSDALGIGFTVWNARQIGKRCPRYKRAGKNRPPFPKESEDRLPPFLRPDRQRRATRRRAYRIRNYGNDETNGVLRSSPGSRIIHALVLPTEVVTLWPSASKAPEQKSRILYNIHVKYNTENQAIAHSTSSQNLLISNS